MKRLVVVGGGNAGTLIANLLADKLEVTVIEPNEYHTYQPGLVDYITGEVDENKIKMPTSSLLKPSVKWVRSKATKIMPENRTIISESGEKFEGDYIVIATGGQNIPVHSLRGYHTIEDAKMIKNEVMNPRGKSFVIGSLPGIIKCPAAPWELSFLIKRKYPDANVSVIVPAKQPPPLQVPMSNMFNKKANELGIKVYKGFVIQEVNYNERYAVSTEGEKIAFDHLIIDTPISTGFSELADKSGLIPVDKSTLAYKDGVFVIGDANSTPTPKTGAAAHFQAEVVANNILAEIEGNRSKESYDGTAICAVYSGPNEGMLVWLNYEKSKALGPTSIYRYMKKAFTRLYWASLSGGVDFILKPLVESIRKS
ncbi:NAD(P)/FAD-dependent oxidoreductase [Saccharolobus solfataricus]|uniref:Oxidoreductase n=3 Tax=Saccharolobus solfataricus TaxID=2287 RepID=Q97UV0_SACS2|nr:FAD/NAD(P)-binding oxidoreductase [Saccharolobus solfataricus]AAK43000.1 Oxidoreductase [Saccharolobus solfataricus P2]AKA73067.1 NAD(P)/FAD-dependent oxidoreductase [Saccharolobus solfataricus]AKA75765.1 NAD(P)/FAD-dependent oxidoreductase [Saccharolobus solfataricus]AKA78457.1 NAD(P)/FAD-dependent oxidoreductase [Saccharolobus solfataricus]AZF67575.1 NAD(P)/FAD-dependent oxidoreductase [Saccharolobus solfataricus]